MANRHARVRCHLSVLALAAAAAAVQLVDVQRVFGATVSWTRAGDGNWTDPTAWSPAPPVAGDTVVLPDLGTSYTVTSSAASVSLAGLTLASPARLNITAGTFNTGAVSNFHNDGSITYNGATLQLGFIGSGTGPIANIRNIHGPTGTLRTGLQGTFGGSDEFDISGLGTVQTSFVTDVIIKNSGGNGAGSLVFANGGALTRTMLATNSNSARFGDFFSQLRTYENLELTDGATVYLNHVAPAVNEPDFAFYGPSILKGDGDFVFGDGSTPGKVNVWVFDNAGTGVGTINAGITMRSGSVNADFRPSNDAVSIINEGTIRADNGRTISITSIKFLNVGTVEAAGGGIVGLSEGRFLNYSAGVVTGGTYIARGAGSLFTFNFVADAITTNNATMITDGAGARFNNLTVLKNNTGTFSLLNAATFAATGSFTNSGRLITKTGGSMLVNGAFTNSGTVDLSGAVAVNYTGASPIAGLVSQLQQGYNGGGWDGPLINSSAAAESDATGVGIIESADYIAANANNVFAGHTVDSTAVLMKYTYYGDTDLNGVVNFDDYARVDSGFNNQRTGWFNGDFDYSGSINFDDYALIDLAFNTQSGTLVRAMDWLEGEDRSDRGMGDPALRLVQQHFEQFGVVYATSFLHAVPEPGCALVALAGLCVCGRRRRR